MKHLPSLALVCILSTPSLAAISPTQERAANSLLSSGKGVEAYQLLRPSISESDGPQAWALFGKSAELADDKNGAIKAYREVLRRDPSANRIKLDLARLLAESGEASESERLFNEVRSLNPPAQVVANIDRYLAMLSDRNKVGSAWRARASAGGGYDSNANQGTNARVVNLYGLPFTLSKSARKQGSAFINFKAELDHIYRFNPNFAWISNLTFGAKKYTAVDNLDTYNLYAATGPVFQPDDKTAIMLPFFASVNRFENTQVSSAKRFYSNEYGVAPQLRYALSGQLNLNLTGTLSRRHYFEQRGRETTVSSITPGFDFKTDKLGTFSIGATLGRELSEASIYSNRQVGANVGWQYGVTDKCVSSLYGQYVDSRYDAVEMAYTQKRHDKRAVAGADLLCTIDMLSADLLLSYQRVWNLSNLPIYQYQKDTVSLTLRKNF